jgi:uncharacterized protein (DUF488 family)
MGNGPARKFDNRNVLLTVGHSNRSIEDFVALLRENGVQHLVDVRAFPRSRVNPQFNVDTLPLELGRIDISYQHAAALGGRRRQSVSIPRDVNGFWTHESFHNYADYALSVEFRGGLMSLLEIAKTRVTAVMCSEAVWWRCHRRIITDYLLVQGADVMHILAPQRTEPARLTNGAAPRPDGSIMYPAEQRSLLP